MMQSFIIKINCIDCRFFSFALLVCALFLFSLSPAIATTGDDHLHSQEKKRLATEIDKKKVNISRLKQGIQAQKEGFEKADLQKKELLVELKEIDLQLLKITHRLQDLLANMEKQVNLIANKEQELEELNQKKQIVVAHIQKRLNAYYKLGKVDLVNITFSSQTLPELLKFHDSFQVVLEYDKNLFQKYRTAITNIEGAQKALKLEKELLEEFILQANEKKEAVQYTLDQKQNLLNRVQTQAVLHKQAIKELDNARKQLAQKILSMKKRQVLLNQAFLLNKTKHIPPIDGKIISLFNQKRVNEFGIPRKTPGISFDAPDGTPIKAIFDGKVVYVGYLKGYGNTVIIDHGYDFYTITSRIEKIFVKNNKIVNKGSKIGEMGSTATLLDDGLYFEIRKRETPLDPIEWLNKDMLALKELSLD